jgi:hypothetical protein
LVSGLYRCTLAAVRLMLVQSLQQPMRDLLEISHNQYRNAKSSTTKLPTISFPSRKRTVSAGHLFADSLHGTPVVIFCHL